MAVKRKKKRILLSLTAVLVVLALGAGIFLIAGTEGETVYVYPFDYVGMTEYWGDSQESYGPVTTDRIQTVFLSDTQTVTEVKVKEGDTVKKGDILMSFDTSLDSLAVERKGVEVEKLKLKLKKLKEELEKVRNMYPYVPGYGLPLPTEPDKTQNETFETAKGQNVFAVHPNQKESGSSVSSPIVIWLDKAEKINESLLREILQEALARRPQQGQTSSSASAIPEFTMPEMTLPPLPEWNLPGLTPPKETEPTEETNQPDATDPTDTTDPTEESNPTDETEPTPPEVKPEEDGVCYAVLRMTKDNMSLGEVTLWQGLRIERIGEDVFIGFFDAGAVPDPWTDSGEPEELPQVNIGSGYTSQQLKQMQSELAKQIKETDFDIRMAEAEYKLMQIEISDGNVYAQIDGQILSVLPEEEARMSRQPMIKLSGGGGFYVQGSVSELEKGNMQPGQEVTINDWNTGMTYTGEVQSVSDFPLNGDNWNGVGNPNASFYPFQVFIGEEADLQEGSYVSVMYSAAQAQNGVYLQTPFVRTEKGQSYVFLMNEKGKLEKRSVRVGKSLWGSYLEILEGITAEDKVAFPYGKAVKEGAPAEEGDLNSLYGY